MYRQAVLADDDEENLRVLGEQALRLVQPRPR